MAKRKTKIQPAPAAPEAKTPLQSAGRPASNRYDLAAVLSRRVTLDAVLIASCSATRTSDADPDAPGTSMQVVVGDVGIDRGGPSGVLVFMPSFSLIMSSEEESTAGPQVNITCEFVVQYLCTDMTDIEDANLQAFATLNVPFNVFPYWREFVQSMTHRLGFKSILIPLFRLPD